MKYSRFGSWGFSIAIVALAISLAAQAQAKNSAGDFLNYLNPLAQKNFQPKNSLNESQDRLIKKERFRFTDVTNKEPVRNLEQGLFVILPGSKLKQIDYAESLLLDKNISGISALIPWSTLEPSEEKYDWSSIDELLALCQKHDKTLILRVSTCGLDLEDKSGKIVSDTPSWVYDNGVKSVKYLDKGKNTHLMPVFWDQTYLAAFANFINEMGSRYDKNMLIQSVGITGGGFLGGTALIPALIDSNGGDKTATNSSGFTRAEQIDEYLRKEQGMSQKQIVDHWKYVADLFPQAFPNTRLNFAINPPTPNRAGENALDEISDYLLFRYGQHIYITRQDLKDGKHSFDDYRVQLKFRADTYAGISLAPTIGPEDLVKLSKTALDDGISFVELPPELLESSDQTVKQALAILAKHLGYQIIMQKASIPKEIFQEEKLKAEFSFLNTGDNSPKRPVRQLDKDLASSYKIMIELKDRSEKVVAKILHTPQKKTEQWKTGEIVSWQQSLKMPKLPAGEYQASVSLYDPDTDKKLNIIDGRDSAKQQIQSELSLGILKIVVPARTEKTTSNVD